MKAEIKQSRIGRGEPAPWKIQEVKNLKAVMEGKETLGIVDISRLPTPQLQQIRKKLKGKAELRVAKNVHMIRALKESGYEELVKLIEGQSGLITANTNPFDLWALMKESMTKGPAKGGELAEDDIVVHQGPTSLKPGPVMGELQSKGVPCKVDKGQIVIQKDTALVKKGNAIDREVASLLKKLEINPITIGLRLRGALFDGTLIGSEHLDVDFGMVAEDVARCHKRAISLAVEMFYVTPETVVPLISLGYQKALNLGASLPYFTAQTIEPLVIRGVSHGRALMDVLENQG